MWSTRLKNRGQVSLGRTYTAATTLLSRLFWEGSVPRALRNLPVAQPLVAKGRLEPHPLALSLGSGSGLLTQAITSTHNSEPAAAAQNVRSSPEGAAGGRLRRLAGRRDRAPAPNYGARPAQPCDYGHRSPLAFPSWTLKGIWSTNFSLSVNKLQ